MRIEVNRRTEELISHLKVNQSSLLESIANLEDENESITSDVEKKEEKHAAKLAAYSKSMEGDGCELEKEELGTIVLKLKSIKVDHYLSSQKLEEMERNLENVKYRQSK